MFASFIHRLTASTNPIHPQDGFHIPAQPGAATVKSFQQQLENDFIGLTRTELRSYLEKHEAIAERLFNTVANACAEDPPQGMEQARIIRSLVALASLMKRAYALLLEGGARKNWQTDCGAQSPLAHYLTWTTKHFVVKQIWSGTTGTPETALFEKQEMDIVCNSLGIESTANSALRLWLAQGSGASKRFSELVLVKALSKDPRSFREEWLKYVFIQMISSYVRAKTYLRQSHKTNGGTGNYLSIALTQHNRIYLSVTNCIAVLKAKIEQSEDKNIIAIVSSKLPKGISNKSACLALSILKSEMECLCKALNPAQSAKAQGPNHPEASATKQAQQGNTRIMSDDEVMIMVDNCNEPIIAEIKPNHGENLIRLKLKHPPRTLTRKTVFRYKGKGKADWQEATLLKSYGYFDGTTELTALVH